MEQGRPSAWSPGERATRYAHLFGAVVAFRARVVATHAKFKLGQNERIDVLADMREALKRDGRWDILAAMDRAKAARELPV